MTNMIKQEVLDLADSMVSAAASFNAHSYIELLNTREQLKTKLDTLCLSKDATAILASVVKLINLTPTSVKPDVDVLNRVINKNFT
jgi:hypothetical protein